MNITHVIGRFGPGGAEMGVVRLIEALKDQPITHAVCSISPDVRMKALLPKDTKCFSLNVLGSSRKAFLSLAMLLRKSGTDIIHVNNLAPWFDCALAGKIAGCKCIETFHGVESDSENFPFSRRLLWKISRKLTYAVTAVAGSAARLFSDLTGIAENGVKVIPNGVDTDLYSPCFSKDGKIQIRCKLGLPTEGILFGCVAALRPVKNHEGLVKTFTDVVAKEEKTGDFGKAYLILVGDGELREELVELCLNLDLGDRVIFAGRRHDVPEILKALDCFVLNSKTEGMSYAILEAMASGLPVIATDVGGNSELISNGKEGFLVNKGDVAGPISHMLNNPDLMESMGRKARDKVCEFYSMDRMVERYRSLYEEVYMSSRR